MALCAIGRPASKGKGRPHLLLPKSREVMGDWRSLRALQRALTPSSPSSLPFMCSSRRLLFLLSAFAITAAPQRADVVVAAQYNLLSRYNMLQEEKDT